ncbi:MAG: alpha/beta hydrolase fold domain-containing protein [Steroidobacteraceae bacterium]
MLTQKASRASVAARGSWPLLLLGTVAGALAASPAVTPEPGPSSQVDAQGVAHLPPVEIPASRFMSAEAREKFIALFSHPAGARESAPPDFRTRRENDEHKNAPFVARDEVLWPVNIEPRVIGGVRTRIITPRAGIAPENRGRVLINLHGGGFIWGEGNGALTESIPIAGVGRITVITVAYREAPEYHFPAASEDVAAVYRELLKDHRAGDIGIYGCSAGGMLAAESVAWFAKDKLPMPGAIGTFCGSIARPGGDAAHTGPLLVGERPSPGVDSDSSLVSNPYFRGASPHDPLVFPINSPELLAHFPPTLLIAGSRDFTVSSLFASQAALAAAGVDAELHVWDGMWHAFLMDPDLPESRQVYQVVVRFFERHLGVTGSR